MARLNLKTLMGFGSWAILSISFVACSPTDRVVKGQVFIVTQGSENIKLGLVEVALIQQGEVEKFLATKQKAINETNAALTDNISKARVALDKARVDLESARREYAGPNYRSITTAVNKQGLTLAEIIGFVERRLGENPPNIQQATIGIAWAEGVWESAQGENTNSIANNRAYLSIKEKVDKLQESANTPSKSEPTTKVSEIKDILATLEHLVSEDDKLSKTRDEAEARLKSAEARLEYTVAELRNFPPERFYFLDFFPVTFAKATTDADGRFSMRCPGSMERDKKFAIYARASRRVAADDEHYLWFFWLQSLNTSEPLLLSNHNRAEDDRTAFANMLPNR